MHILTASSERTEFLEPEPNWLSASYYGRDLKTVEDTFELLRLNLVRVFEVVTTIPIK